MFISVKVTYDGSPLCPACAKQKKKIKKVTKSDCAKKLKITKSDKKKGRNIAKIELQKKGHYK